MEPSKVKLDYCCALCWPPYDNLLFCVCVAEEAKSSTEREWVLHADFTASIASRDAVFWQTKRSVQVSNCSVLVPVCKLKNVGILFSPGVGESRFISEKQMWHGPHDVIVDMPSAHVCITLELLNIWVLDSVIDWIFKCLILWVILFCGVIAICVVYNI